MPDRPLTLTQTATALGLSRSAVWGLIARGKLTAHQRHVVGHARPLWFVQPADVDAYRTLRGARLGKRGRPRNDA